ncbi:unnamed protein product, partial [Staurois parvus]
MRRCSGGPCSTYLVLRSHDVSPAASPAISSGRCRHPASVFRTYGRRLAAGNFKNLKNVIFFFFNFKYALSLCPACILSVLS